jgi:hypothetical protein
MREKPPRYSPEGTEVRIKDVPIGTWVDITFVNGKKNSALVKEVIETPQDGNPIIGTSIGKLGSGTSVVVNSDLMSYVFEQQCGF